MNPSNPPPSLVIIGNGMVTGRFLDELLKRTGITYTITVIGAEPYGSYNRIMLSAVLAKSASINSIVQKDTAWYEAQNIKLLSGSPITTINRKEKFVKTENGECITYDELVLATGSDAIKIPFPNADLKHIFTFRNISDTEAMITKAHSAKRALVIGGGLLGLEAAYGLSQAGVHITLLQKGGWLLNRQLDKRAALMLEDIMRDMNVNTLLSENIVSFEGQGDVERVCFESGLTLDIDMVVMAVGVRPQASLGLNAGLKGKHAIHVDDFMHTSDPHISAIGECVEHNGLTFGMVDPLWRQAETLAARLIENKKLPFEQAPIPTKLKVSGVHVFSAGAVETKNDMRALIASDTYAKIYRKILLKDNKIVGIVLFGDVRSGPYYFDLMQNKKDVSTLLPNLIFGQAYCSDLTPQNSSEETTAHSAV